MAKRGDNQVAMLEALEPERQRAPNAERKSLLGFLKRRRNEQGPAVIRADDGAFGFAALAIPPLDFHVLRACYPDLNSKDADTRTREWKRLLMLGVLDAYKIDDSIGKRKPNHGIIVR